MDDPRILVVDDNKDFADVFCDILKANDYKARSCYSGAEAVELVKSGEVDLVFMDIRMPGQNGVETLKKMKEARPETLVVMMTGYSVDEMVDEAVKAKASEVVYKPFEIEKVLALIRNF